MRQVAAVRQIKPQHGVARLERREIDAQVGLAARVGLDIGMLGAEELLGTVAGQIFDNVDAFAAAVVAPAGIPFGVFIRKHAADGLHHRRARIVFAGDHFEAIFLALDLGGDGRPDGGVFFFNKIHRGPRPPGGDN